MDFAPYRGCRIVKTAVGVIPVDIECCTMVKFT